MDPAIPHHILKDCFPEIIPPPKTTSVPINPPTPMDSYPLMKKLGAEIEQFPQVHVVIFGGEAIRQRFSPVATNVVWTIVICRDASLDRR